MNKKAILEKIKSQKNFLKKEYGVKTIGVFGSVVQGKDTIESDVDILVEFETPVGFFEFIKLEDFLSGMLEKKVDLISKKAVKPAVRKEIFSEVVYV